MDALRGDNVFWHADSSMSRRPGCSAREARSSEKGTAAGGDALRVINREEVAISASVCWDGSLTSMSLATALTPLPLRAAFSAVYFSKE